jgi:hypothetical protein
MATGDQTLAFANRCTAKIAGSSGTPAAFAFAVMKDIEITWSADHVPVFGFGSIRRQGVAKHQQKVQVKVGSMKFNPAITSSVAWWSYITGPTNGGATNEDTNSVKLFDVDGYFTFEDGQVLHGTVYSVFFPNLSFKGSEGQWVKLDVTGEGSYVTWAAS